MTDSQYCINVLQNNCNVNKNIKLVEDIKQNIKEYKDVHFYKVKAHSGDKYNDMADELAKDN